MASVLIVLALLVCLENLYSLKGGMEFLSHCRRARRFPADRYHPPLTVIVPCRNVDPGLEENLAAFFRLDYPDFRLLFVTGDAADPSVEVIEGVRQRFPSHESLLLFAGAAKGRSQKVHNLAHAVDRLRGRDEVIVFADSDIRPHSDWLRRLVARLENPEAGLSTGFRWYLPQRGGFASRLRSAWNAGILTLMRERNSPFAWGGAMGVRRKVFEECRVREAWRSALSDDYAISRAVRSSGRRIHFEPGCISFSHEDCGPGELWEWSFRQVAITRVYHPGLWRLSFLSQLVSVTAFWGGSAWIVWQATAGWTLRASILTGLIGLGYFLGVIKGELRVRALWELFPTHERALRRHRWAYLLWGPLTALVSLQALIRSGFSREIEWRGIRYRMISPQRTEVLDPEKGMG